MKYTRATFNCFLIMNLLSFSVARAEFQANEKDVFQIRESLELSSGQTDLKGALQSGRMQEALQKGEIPGAQWCSAFLIRTGSSISLLTANICVGDQPGNRFLVNSTSLKEMTQATAALPYDLFQRANYREVITAVVDQNTQKTLGAQALELADKAPQAGDQLTIMGYPRGIRAERTAQCKFVGSDISQVVDLDGLERFKLMKEMTCFLKGSPDGMFGGPVLNQTGQVVGVLIEMREKDPEIIIAGLKMEEKNASDKGIKLERTYIEGEPIRTKLYYAELLKSDVQAHGQIQDSFKDGVYSEKNLSGSFRAQYEISGGHIFGPFSYFVKNSAYVDIFGVEKIYFSGTAGPDGLVTGTVEAYYVNDKQTLGGKIFNEEYQGGVQLPTSLHCQWGPDGKLLEERTRRSATNKGGNVQKIDYSLCDGKYSLSPAYRHK